MYRLLWISLFCFGCEAEKQEVIEGEIIDVDDKKNDSHHENEEEQTDAEAEEDQQFTDIDIHIEEDWESSSCYIATITNIGEYDSVWEVTIHPEKEISTVENAELILQEDKAIFTGKDNNYILEPNQETQFDYCVKP